MPTLIAINEIHRDGKDGKTEVIAPGKKFSATAEEVKLLVDKFGAAKKAGKADEGDDEDDSDDTNAGPTLADLSAKQLSEKAVAMGIELPKGNPSKATLISLIEAKSSEVQI